MTKIELSESLDQLKTSKIQQALKASSNPDIISFSLGMPSTELLPLDKYKKALSQIHQRSYLQYSSPSSNLKVQIAELMKKRFVNCTPDQVFLTSGAQQAMALIVRLLANKDDDIIVDDATYPGFIQIAQSFGVNLVSMTNNSTLELEKYFTTTTKKPKLVYTMSEGHNPCGTSLSQESRINLTNFSKMYNIPILEDDAYGFLNYDDGVKYPLKYYANDLVLYVGSFSKILSPSLRVGWIIAPKYLVNKLEILKETSDINAATLSQHIVSSYLDTKDLDSHLQLIRKSYKLKRDTMINALNTYLPEVEFTTPKSGFFIWCKLPKEIDAAVLFKNSIENFNVSFLPGSAFGTSTDHNLKHYMRLSFAFCNTSLIEEGVKRLSLALHNSYLL